MTSARPFFSAGYAWASVLLGAAVPMAIAMRARDVITNNCEPDVNGWRRFAPLDGQNESATSRVTSAFGLFRRSVSRVCDAFVAHLPRSFRATHVRGWPFTQGGARRLRRLALPWANLFCPFGAGRFLDAWPDSAGLVVLRVPADVIRPSLRLEGAMKKKPRAERHGGAATRRPRFATPRQDPTP